MTDRPTSTKPRAGQASDSACIVRSPNSGGTAPDSELTARAREVLAFADMNAQHRSILASRGPISIRPLAVLNLHSWGCLRLTYAKANKGGRIVTRALYHVTDLGREVARLLAAEGK